MTEAMKNIGAGTDRTYSMSSVTAPTSRTASADLCRKIGVSAPGISMISTTVSLDDVDVLLVPDSHDQLFMKSMEPRLHAYLASGGHFFINGHLVLPWLPCLSPFKAVKPKPFSNWMIRPANPGRYFGRMDFENFHRWEGILGQYARGYSPCAARRATALPDWRRRMTKGPSTGSGGCPWRKGVHAQRRQYRNVLFRPAPTTESLPRHPERIGVLRRAACRNAATRALPTWLRASRTAFRDGWHVPPDCEVAALSPFTSACLHFWPQRLLPLSPWGGFPSDSRTF